MSVFKDIGAKLTNASQDAVKKTKDLGDIAKLNSQINSEKSNIQELYNEIGRLYCELYPNVNDEKIASLRTLVNSSKNKIIEYQDLILDIKGIKKCPQCGNEIVKTALFCTNCGFSLASAVKEEEKEKVGGNICPKCNTDLPDGAAFCIECGNKI